MTHYLDYWRACFSRGPRARLLRAVLEAEESDLPALAGSMRSVRWEVLDEGRWKPASAWLAAHRVAVGGRGVRLASERTEP